MKPCPNIFLIAFLSSFCCQAQTITEMQQLLIVGNELMADAQYSEAIDTYREGLKRVPFEGQEEDATVGKLHLNIGKGMMALKEMDSALIYLNTGLELLASSLGDQHEDVADAHHNLGMVLKDKGQAFEALTHYQKALVAYQQSTGTRTVEVARVYNSMGQANFYVRNFGQAIENQEQGIDIIKHLYGEKHQELGELYVSLAYALQVVRNYEEATERLKEAIQIYQNQDGNNQTDLAYAYFMLGLTTRGRKQYQEALPYFKQALQIEESVYGDRHPDVARTRTYIGIIYRDLKNNDEALRYFQRSLISCTRDFSDLDVHVNPREKHVILNKGRLMDALDYKAFTLYQRYVTQSSQQADLIAALESLEFLLQLIDERRQTLQNRADVGVLYGKSRGVLELFMEICFELYEQSLDPAYVNRAFQAGELIRHAQLADGVRTSRASQYIGLPQHLQEMERKLDGSIRETIGALTSENKDIEKIDTARVMALSDQLKIQEASKDSLMQLFRDQYPKYFALQHELAIPTIQNVQAYLPDSSLLIEFFLGRENVFVFGLNEEKLMFNKVRVDTEFFSQLERFSQFSSQSSEYSSDPDSFEILGHRLYQSLLAPLLFHMSRPNMILIPDAQLGYCPFELLATDTTEGSATFAQLAYLIRRHQVQYEYSSTLLVHTSVSSDPADQGYLGYAPEYGSGVLADNETVRSTYRGLRDDLAPLIHNQSEIRQSSDLFEGRAKLGKTATKSSFESEAGDATIVHLAMHALVNDSVPEYSGLVFTSDPDSREDHFLYAYELYGMRLKTKLAVLSACETGLGKFQRGEGIMSLAHAFKYAGCPNIVMSLWKADDQATSEIMVDFFTHLRNGLPKAAALRKAKLDYLAQAPAASSHPFYWGTFVLIGDNTPIEMPQTWWPWLIGMLALGILLMFVISNRKKSWL